MTKTENFNLLLPSRDDKFDIELFNKNMRTLDASMKAVDDRTAAVSPIIKTNIGDELQWNMGEVTVDETVETLSNLVGNLILDNGYENFTFILRKILLDMEPLLSTEEKNDSSLTFKVTVTGHKDATEVLDTEEGEENESDTSSEEKTIRYFSTKYTVLVEFVDPKYKDCFTTIYDSVNGTMEEWINLYETPSKLEYDLLVAVVVINGTERNLFSHIKETASKYNQFQFIYNEMDMGDSERLPTLKNNWLVKVMVSKLTTIENKVKKSFHIIKSLLEEPYTILCNDYVEEEETFVSDNWYQLYPIDIPDVPLEHWRIKTSITASEIASVVEDPEHTEIVIAVFPYIYTEILVDRDAIISLSSLDTDDVRLKEYKLCIKFNETVCNLKFESIFNEITFIWLNGKQDTFEANHRYLVEINEDYGTVIDLTISNDSSGDDTNLPTTPDDTETGDNTPTKTATPDWIRKVIEVPQDQDYADFTVNPYEYTVFDGAMNGESYYFNLIGDPIRDDGRVAQYKFQCYFGNTVPTTISVGYDGNSEFITRQIKKYMTEPRTFYLVEIIEDFCNITVYSLSEDETSSVKENLIENEDGSTSYNIGDIHVTEEPNTTTKNE